MSTGDHIPLDDIDRSILQWLQRDARHSTAVEMAEAIGVSDGTIRNRIEQLERDGVIEGYVPLINYEAACYQLQVRVMCTAPVVEREHLANQALQIDGVIEIRELMTGNKNIEVTAVPPKNEDPTYIAEALSEIGLEVETEDIIRQHYIRPFSYFGPQEMAEEEAKDLPGDVSGG